MKFPTRFLPYFQIFVGAFLVFLLTSCSDCFTSTGEITRQVRQIAGDFDEIETFDNVNVVLVPDNVSFVEVRAGKNLLSSVKTELIGNRLFIRNPKKCNWIRNQQKELAVYVHYRRLSKITNWGIADVSNEGTLQSNNLQLIVEGQGDIRLRVQIAQTLACNLNRLGNIILEGSADVLSVEAFVNGFLTAPALRTRICGVACAGEGDCTLRVGESLEVFIDKNASLYYYGSPTNLSLLRGDKARGRFVRKGD